jgi:hypothetical protein
MRVTGSLAAGRQSGRASMSHLQNTSSQQLPMTSRHLRTPFFGTSIRQSQTRTNRQAFRRGKNSESRLQTIPNVGTMRREND